MNINWRLPNHVRGPPTATINDSLQTSIHSPSHSSASDIEDFILYNRTYRVRICVTHGFAVRNLPDHLRDEHTLTRAQRKAILEAHADDVCVRPETVKLPAGLVTPIEGLSPAIEAQQCRGERCSYTSPSDDVIRKHANKEHGWRKSPDKPTYWHWVQAQTFFTSGGLVRWFTVHVTEADAADAISDHHHPSPTECPPAPTPSQYSGRNRVTVREK